MIAVSIPVSGRLADRVARDLARAAQARQLAPIAVAASSLGLGVIGGAWFTESSGRGEAIGCVAIAASLATAEAARLMDGPRVTAATAWVRAACVLLAELAAYAGLAGGVSMMGGTGLAGPLAPQLSALAPVAGPGAGGVWLLALIAAAGVALRHMTDLCTASPATEPARRLLRPGLARLPVAGIALILGGARLALLAAATCALIGLLYAIVRPAASVTPDPKGVAGYRGDGPLSAWIGGFVAGKLPPLAPLLAGLVVTCMLAALGLANLPGILVLTPAEGMLLASLGSSHLHAGPQDWRVPPLLQFGEYVLLIATGDAGHVPPPATFALVAAVGLRHLDMAYRARERVPLSWFMSRRRSRLPRADWRGLGWEGRVIIAGLALLFGVTMLAYAALAAYLAALAVMDYLAGWINARPRPPHPATAPRPPSPPLAPAPDDAAVPDAEDPDAAPVPDAPVPDAAVPDAAPVPDAEVPDAAVPDAAPVPDAEVPDAAPVPDAAVPGAAAPDGALPDGAVPDGVVLHAEVPDGVVADGVVPDDSLL